jgi:glycosyltransferase involved in cell wall biosynthesis
VAFLWRHKGIHRFVKILYFSRDYTTHDHRFLAKLAQTDHQVFYLRLERRGPQLEDRPLPPEIEIVPWSGGQAPAALNDSPRLVWELKGILRRLKPDLVQAGPIQRAAFLAALAGARPLVSVSWGYDLLHDAQRSLWWARATRYTLRRSAAFVGDCNTIRRLALEYGMRADRIVTFPWGVDLAHFTPHAPRTASEPIAPFTLLSTRSWEPIYDVETIAKAFVRAVHLHPGLRLVLLGAGSQAGTLRRILKDVEAAPDGLPRVLYPGQVGYADLPRYYRSADLYLSASHSDGSSISLLEALACGLPALVSDIPGNQEWVTPGENGWLFPIGDVAALTQGILNAAEQRQQLPALGLAARHTAEQRANWDGNFPKLLEAYRMALASA